MSNEDEAEGPTTSNGNLDNFTHLLDIDGRFGKLNGDKQWVQVGEGPKDQ